MKTKDLVIGLIVVSLVLAIYGYFKATSGLENETEARPQISIAPQSFDFGEINYGDIMEYTFIVKNTGQANLEIKKVATSCGCTTAQISQKIIAPQQEAELKVQYDSGAMSGAHAKGKQERIIYVKSNDPVSPQIEAMIYAYVR